MIALWMKFAFETTMLALEAQQVIGLRMMRLSVGGKAAEREVYRMVSEKAVATAQACLAAAGGKSAEATLRRVRRRVRANRRRLSGF